MSTSRIINFSYFILLGRKYVLIKKKYIKKERRKKNSDNFDDYDA